mgnify:CR=1 FL=1|jgi:hypothetical protein
MDIQKPAPLMIGGKAYYTLTSYDPVSIEIDAMLVTDSDVSAATLDMVTQAGGTEASLKDAGWLKHKLGFDDPKKLRSSIRDQLIDTSYEILLRKRRQACAEELAKRLVQSVPSDHIAETRQQLKENIAQQAQASGISFDRFLAQMGTDTVAFEATLDEQAKMVAEQDAALGAYAQAKKLKISEEDYPRLLNIPASQCQRLVEHARQAHHEDQVYDSALRNRALELIVAECTCSYRQETAHEAATRSAQMQAWHNQSKAGSTDNPHTQSPQKNSGGNSDLHLV